MEAGKCFLTGVEDECCTCRTCSKSEILLSEEMDERYILKMYMIRVVSLNEESKQERGRQVLWNWRFICVTFV